MIKYVAFVVLGRAFVSSPSDEQTESVTESAMILVGRVFVWRQQARVLGTRLAPAARIIR